MSEDILKVGIIGLGQRGLYLSSFVDNPNNNIIVSSGADVDNNALKKFKESLRGDIFVTRDYHEILNQKEIDVVIIASPDHLHEEHAIASLKAGKATYLEKPMAVSIEGCDRILKVCCESRGKLYLGHNMRHMPFVKKMKDIIDEGMIGEVRAGWCRHFISYGGDAYYKDWHADRTKTTSLLIHKGTHDIDILHWLCGSYTTRVCAMGGLVVYNYITDRHDSSTSGDTAWHEDYWPPLSQRGLNPIVDVEDLSMILMQLENRIFASYQQCHFTPDAWRNYTIIGTEGRVENFGDAAGECLIRVWKKRTNYSEKGDFEYRISDIQSGHGGADESIMSEFIQYVRDGSDIHSTAFAARNSVAVGCMATESLRQGGIPFDIPLL